MLGAPGDLDRAWVLALLAASVSPMRGWYSPQTYAPSATRRDLGRAARLSRRRIGHIGHVHPFA